MDVIPHAPARRPPVTPIKGRKALNASGAHARHSGVSEVCRPVVVSPLKRPNDGQRRVTLRSGWTLSLHVTWG
ncbi:hypothetical protein L0V18_002472 [Citrobacter youngae]|nr:hypothetical protein [Citrobacter youngae]